jgi:hypothetical protein
VMVSVGPALIPTLLQLIQRQEEGQELCDDTWNVAAAAGVCLRLTLTAAGDAALPLVVPFIQVRIVHATTTTMGRWYKP